MTVASIAIYHYSNYNVHLIFDTIIIDIMVTLSSLFEHFELNHSDTCTFIFICIYLYFSIHFVLQYYLL